MRRFATISLCILTGLILKGQSTENIEEGYVSFITSQNVYLKFPSTKNIKPGDTLFLLDDEKRIPALRVTNLSSMSCVCVVLNSIDFSVDDRVYSIKKPDKSSARPKEVVVNETLLKADSLAGDTLAESQNAKNARKQEVSGRISISSYSNFSNVADFSQRMRYTLSLNAQNISDSKFSCESYISFVHKNDDWNEIQEDVFNGLKIYNLALKYDINNSTEMWIGRKINPKLSNIGAVDGLQAEKRYRSFSFGGVVGFRPDYEDYGFNANLFQFGAYVNHEYTSKKGFMQSSVAFIEQTNSGNTDRRFTYFQHTNALVKNLYFFGTLEVNLYKKVNEQTDNKPTISNIYLSLRYKIIKQLSLSISYSARDNVIYYETYKDIVERLLEQETRQGYRAQINYRSVKYLAVGVNAGYRFSKQDPKPSKNLYAYITYSRIPFIEASTTVSFTLLETSYLSGKIFSFLLNKDLIKGKLFGGLGYRHVDYSYLSSEYSIPQNMAEINLSWRIMKKLFASLNYEGTFENQNNYNRIYINLSQRF